MSGVVLIVDDDAEMRSFLEADLRLRGFSSHTAASAAGALEVLRSTSVDTVLTDIYMPETSGLEMCKRVGDLAPGVPVVVMTAFGSMETAVDALRAGAFDFVTKPLDADLLEFTLRRAIGHRRLEEQVRVLRNPVTPGDELEELRGNSPVMREVRSRIRRVAETDMTVLITGESGTGKELAAREIGRLSGRSSGPFVAVNCAAIPEALVESELFGHAKGAFTDARVAREGLFMEAHRGTLFLDEVGEIPTSMQAKLLRALEGRTFRPVGAARDVSVDVRVIAATNRNLLEAVADGRFREDLFYRINVLPLQLPPLRERGSDPLGLAQMFLEQFSVEHGKEVVGFTDHAARRILGYPWPGNVRELRNAVESALVLADVDRIRVEDLPTSVRNHQGVVSAGDQVGEPRFSTLDELERDHILRVLQAVGNRKSEAARILGLDRKTLYRKLKQFDDEGNDSRQES